MVAAASPVPARDAWSADWLGTSDPEAAAPWLYDAAGNPVRLTDDVIGWRARFLPPGARGIGEICVDQRTGRPLFISRSIDPEELCALVGHRPGRYRLAAVDGNHEFLRSVPVGCFVVTEAMAAVVPVTKAAASTVAPSSTDATMARLLELMINKLSSNLDKLTDAVQAQTSNGALQVSELVRASATVVTAADGAGISRRDPLPIPAAPPVVVAPPAPPAPSANENAQPQPFDAIADTLSVAVDAMSPSLSHWLNTKVFGMSPEMSTAFLSAMAKAKGNAAASAPDAPAAAAVASGPAAAPPATPAPPATAASPTPASASTPADLMGLMPHLAAIERLLTPDEAKVVRELVANLPPEQSVELAREVQSRSAPDAAAWIRSLLAEVTASGATGAGTGR